MSGCARSKRALKHDLQDLALGALFVLSGLASAITIPIIDISPLMSNTQEVDSGAARTTCVGALTSAAEELGVFYVVGHGKSTSELNNALRHARDFFDIPEEEKQRLRFDGGSGLTRGYIPYGEESGSDALETKEAFSYGYPWDEAVAPLNKLQGPNVWPSPELLPMSWRANMLETFDTLVGVSEALTRGLSMGGVWSNETYLPSLCEGGDTISLLRVFHYFRQRPENDAVDTEASRQQQQKEEKEVNLGGGQKAEDGAREQPTAAETDTGTIGSSPHTDWGFLTVILQDDTGGLQVQLPSSRQWVDVPPIEGALVVNAGDFLSLVSGGRIKSPVHRVLSPGGGTERLSFVFFYYPNYEARVLRVEQQGKETCMGQGREEQGVGQGEEPQSDEAGVEAYLAWEEEAVDGEEEEEEMGGEQLMHNTLLVNSQGRDINSMSFGDYLSLKWEDVFRGEEGGGRGGEAGGRGGEAGGRGGEAGGRGGEAG